MDHVRLGEHAAATGDAGSLCRAEDHVADIFDVVQETARLLVHERARAGGTVAVGLVVRDAGAAAVRLQTDELGGLAAHLEDCHDLRMQAGEPPGDGLELVLVRGLQHLAEEPATGARQAQPFDVLAGHGRQQVVEKRARRFARAALEASVPRDQHRTAVDLGQAGRRHEEEIWMLVGEAGEQADVADLAHERRFEADAADIYAKANHAALRPYLSETAKRRLYRLVCGVPSRKASEPPPWPTPCRCPARSATPLTTLGPKNED